MAFGKPPEKKKFIPAVVADQLWRSNVHSEERACDNWHTKWGWILKEYADLHEQLEVVARDSIILKEMEKKEFVDSRTIKPFPNSVNHEYGWIPTRAEFRLEKYGPDVDKGMPLPKE